MTTPTIIPADMVRALLEAATPAAAKEPGDSRTHVTGKGQTAVVDVHGDVAVTLVEPNGRAALGQGFFQGFAAMSKANLDTLPHQLGHLSDHGFAEGAANGVGSEW